jgi:hypothetical protein
MGKEGLTHDPRRHPTEELDSHGSLASHLEPADLSSTWMVYNTSVGSWTEMPASREMQSNSELGKALGFSTRSAFWGLLAVCIVGDALRADPISTLTTAQAVACNTALTATLPRLSQGLQTAQQRVSAPAREPQLFFDAIAKFVRKRRIRSFAWRHQRSGPSNDWPYDRVHSNNGKEVSQ